jgi:hypoxanthine phosphoribosyltransferase
MMPWLVLYLVLVHALFVNVYEKLLAHTAFGRSPRPSAKCSEGTTDAFECMGMPSGHAECAVIACVLLVLRDRVISAPVALILVLAIGVQRVAFKRHTPVQVVAGCVIGLLYGMIYLRCSTIQSVLMPIAISVALVAAVTLVADRRMTRTPVPRWIDPDLMGLLHKKRNTTFLGKMAHPAVIPFFHEMALFCNWDKLEFNMAKLHARIEASNTKFDAVVGIKSGGAFVSNYLSKRLRLPNQYLKLATNCKKNVVMSAVDQINKNYDAKNASFGLCEDGTSALEGKRVLLVDDVVDSGATMLACRRFLMEKKGVASVVAACVRRRESAKRFPYPLIESPSDFYLVWPWGYDS